MNRLLKLAAVVALALAGCLPAETAQTLVLTPDPELAEATEQAAREWREATDLDVRVGPDGVPVVLVDGGPCGVTWNTPDGPELIEIRRDCPPAQFVLHEIGHALTPDLSGHADEGLMAFDLDGLDYVDEAAIERVCSVRECALNEEE